MGAAVTEEAIQHSRICESTDPKDKVYALLELLKSPLITVDYNLSTETVYAMFTQAVIQQEQTLRILRLQALPPWVPNFSVLRPVDILPEPPHRYPTVASYGLANVSSCLRFSGFEMTLGGCKLDTIKSVAEELLADKANYPGSTLFSETMRKWESLAVELQHHRSSQSICAAFHRTLRAQHGFGPLFDPEEHHSRYPPPPRWIASYNCFVAGVLRSFGIEYFRDLEVMVEWAGAAYQEFQEASDIEMYMTAIKRACYGRSFFIADKGSMGLAPPRAESGDIIVYLQGGVHPFILRPNGESVYSLIGD